MQQRLRPDRLPCPWRDGAGGRVQAAVLDIDDRASSGAVVIRSARPGSCRDLSLHAAPRSWPWGNACVDRAGVGETRIRRGAKIDNLVQVGHGSDVGENSLLCGQAGLAGSSKIGRNVVLAGQVGVAGHLTIGDNVIATAQSGIPNDVEANKVVSGYPAMDNSQWLKCAAAYARLPEMFATYRKVLRFLEKQDAGS